MENELNLLNRLRECRTEKNISQGDLAEMVGVSRNTISSIEKGQYSPSAKLAYALCIVLGKKFDDVFFFEDYPTTEELPAPERMQSLSDKGLQRILRYLSDKGWTAEQTLDFISYIVS